MTVKSWFSFKVSARGHPFCEALPTPQGESSLCVYIHTHTGCRPFLKPLLNLLQ